MKKDVENMSAAGQVAEAVTYLAEKKKRGEYIYLRLLHS